MTKPSRLPAPSSLALTLAIAPKSFAQTSEEETDSARQLDVVIVTAEKREENLQDTPISISAFTAASIERSGVSNISELAETAPNVIFDTTAPISGASNASSIFVPGIGQSDFALTTEAGVGTYVDGVYSSRSLGGVLDVLDIE